MIGSGTTAIMTLSPGPAVGIGTASPAGGLHVTGAGAISGAGLAINSVAAVTSIQTIFAAGTIARGAGFLIMDRNNTGGAVYFNISLAAAISTGFTYANTDTITVSITAGGAVTVQRTAGTNGTHDISMLAIFL